MDGKLQRQRLICLDYHIILEYTFLALSMHVYKELYTKSRRDV